MEKNVGNNGEQVELPESMFCSTMNALTCSEKMTEYYEVFSEALDCWIDITLVDALEKTGIEEVMHELGRERKHGGKRPGAGRPRVTHENAGRTKRCLLASVVGKHFFPTNLYTPLPSVIVQTGWQEMLANNCL